MAIARQNHYVPEWYQKRFLSSNKSVLYYLDLSPPLITLPNGGKKTLNAMRWPFSPTQCFCAQDLYTTSYFGFLNDQIERHLFGKIDGMGSKAVAAMAEQEYVKLHDNFHNFFEYLDAQKIRTPKGLAWLNEKFPNLTYNQLLHEMQHIRQLHCTIWTETVREIVYAKNSRTKFIISDHPVTVYNLACSPDSEECIYPNEPRIEMKATQTIFPLDSTRCLILTNLDYARNPNLSDPKMYRPNATPFRPTLARMDNTICKRELQDDEVAAINLIIKLRAKQFLASETEEWLYPEVHIDSTWAELGKVLLPPSNELYHFGGEVYIGYKDGSSSYHDAYGRTCSVATYLKKSPVEGKIGPNAQCPCGSGKKHKKCCRGKPLEECPSHSECSIRERNIMFFNILVAILGLEENKDWAETRRNLTDKKIADIYKAIGSLWPPETDIMSLLPKPDVNVTRALYSGLLDPQVAYKNVAPLILYTDEMIILNPFINPNIVQKEYSPIHNPSQYRQATIKNIIFFILFMPLIESGRINLIPDPINFNPALRDQIFHEADKRRNQVKLDDISTKEMEELAKEDFRRFIYNGSDEQVKSVITHANPNISSKKLSEAVKYVRAKNEEDPLAILQQTSSGENNGQVLMSQLAPNLEMGMFLAQATGAFVLTSHPYRWSEICSSVNYFYGDSHLPWEKLATHMTNREINLLHFYDQKDFLTSLNFSEFHYMKEALRNIWNAVQEKEPSYPEQIDNLIRGFDNACEKVDSAINNLIKRKNKKCKEYLRVVKSKAQFSSKIAPAGHSTNAVYRILLAHAGHEKYLKSLPLSLYVKQQEELMCG